MNLSIRNEDKMGYSFEDSKNNESKEVKEKYDYVDDDEEVKDLVEDNESLNDNNMLLRNCFSDAFQVTEVNDNLLVESISSEMPDDLDRLHNFFDRNDDNELTTTARVAEENHISGDQVTQSNELTNFMKKKRKKIFSALVNDDVEYLKEAAISTGGLLSDDIRRKVWPKLLGVDVIETSPRPSQEDIENHHYYNQVVLDVNRSLKRFPPSIKEAQRLAMLDQLVLLIMRVLCRHPELHYYQGYHDICVTFLLVLGEETAYYVVEKLSKTHLDVFMKKSMEHTIEMLNCMYPLIAKKSSQLSNFLLKSEVGVGYCISWLITWFGHVLNDYDTVVRLFDFFLVSDPVMPLYLTSAVVLHREADVLQQDCDMASIHSLLSKVPDELPFENLILESLKLFENYKYKKLKQESAYLNDSRLKPRRRYTLVQSLARKIKSSVPASNFTVPLVIAAAVLVTAVLYQAYKY